MWKLTKDWRDICWDDGYCSFELLSDGWYGYKGYPYGLYERVSDQIQIQINGATMNSIFTKEQLNGIVAVLNYLISITPCSGKQNLENELAAAQKVLGELNG